MVLLPKSFDENEIYILCIGLFMLSLFALLPKCFPPMVTICIYLYNLFLVTFVDHVLAGPPLDKYDIMDNPKFEVFDIWIYFLIYTISGYFFLCLYDRIRRSLIRSIFYIITAAVITICLEWISLHFNVFKYKEWSLTFSFFSYIFLYSSNVCFLFMINHIRGKQTT
jgi:hypothetical protein